MENIDSFKRLAKETHPNFTHPYHHTNLIITHHVVNLISDSFKRLAKETHPDRPNGNKEQFQKLHMAFIRALKTIEVIFGLK